MNWNCATRTERHTCFIPFTVSFPMPISVDSHCQSPSKSYQRTGLRSPAKCLNCEHVGRGLHSTPLVIQLTGQMSSTSTDCSLPGQACTSLKKQEVQCSRPGGNGKEHYACSPIYTTSNASEEERTHHVYEAQVHVADDRANDSRVRVWPSSSRRGKAAKPLRLSSQ